MRLLAAAASCLLALFLGAGAALWAERPSRWAEGASHFRLVRGGGDDAVWRLDERTGQVSVCGTALTGRGLSEMEARLAAHIRAAGHDAGRLRALLPEIDELNALSRPRCSLWSVGEGGSVDERRTELDMNAPE